jgi:hypothetical protein
LAEGYYFTAGNAD